MKKTLILASLLAFSMTAALAVENTTPTAPAKNVIEAQKPEICNLPPRKPDFKKEQFEKRLNLTEKQKAKAKEIRQKGHEEMKPVMEQIKLKRQEAEAVKLSRIAPQMQKEKLDKIDAELRDLRKQAHELRMKNMKEFESILTKKQKKELEKMKQEGRKRFEQEHRRPGHGPQFPHPPVEK